MPRIAVINFVIGFFVLFVAAGAGAFIATDLTNAFVRDQVLLNSWSAVLSRSAHGHTNLFALMHICFGLTLPYSIFSQRIKIFQTVALAAGTFAMGPLMILRSQMPPSENYDAVGIAIGVCLSAALVMIFSHAAGLLGKLLKRE